MQKQITIGDPYLRQEKDKTKLCSLLSTENEQYEMWFEVDREYEPYLCTERCDAFVLALLFYCLKNKVDMVSETPISKELYYKLKNEYIPVLGNHTDEFFPFTMQAPLTSEKLPNKGAVGTGVSGGVDSFFSILKHYNLPDEMKDYEITHLTFFNMGSHGDFGGEEARKLFHARGKRAEKIASELQLPVVFVDSNISEFIKVSFLPSVSIRNLSAVMALQKLFCRYYLSAGTPIFWFQLDASENDRYDLLNTYAVSNENVTVHNSGLAETRLEKIGFIADFPSTHKYLNVCVRGDENCGVCEKCIRTMNALYAMQKLDLFSETFNLDEYYKNLPKRIAVTIEQTLSETIAKPTHLEILDKMRENGIEIPAESYSIAKKARRRQKRAHLARMIRGKASAIKRKWLK